MKSLFKYLSNPLSFAWGKSLTVALASLTLAAPALGEGSQQLGIGPEGLNVYLFEYDAINTFTQGTNRGIRVNVESPGQVINISLCGWSYGADAGTRDDLAIEVFRPSGTEINYTATEVAATSPGSFSPAAANNRGAWLLTEGNASTATQTTLCTNQNKPASAAGQLTTPVRFVAPEAGTYEIRLYNDTQASNSNNAIFTYFDITVTSSTSVNPNPSANNGQVWASSWAFNAGNTFSALGSYDADLYIRTPGGRSGTEFIWQLDLNRFAPYIHEIVANSIGLNAPNSRASALGTSGATYNRQFPIYLSPPNSSSSVAPILPEPAPATITNLRFVDNADIDNTISPNSTTGIQDSGFFRFNTDVAGTYKITIDTNSSGTFDNGDRVLFGDATAGANSIQWDGRGINSAVLPSGTYQTEISIGLGEYHFVTFDSETSGGGTNNGLSIWKWNSLSARTPGLNFWDDTKITGGTRNLAGSLSNTPGGRHTWGTFASGGIGDTNFIDTWVFSSAQTLQTQAIITATDDDFGDAPDTGTGTGTGNYQTTSSDNGPNHTIVSGIRLGANIDLDSGTLQNANADADDTNGTPNDEDGVTLRGNSLQNQTLTQGANATLNIATQGSGVLNAWIDWNRDGDFLDSGEQIATNTAPTSNAIALPITVPAGASIGTTYARFRYSSQTGLASTGSASNGEVEDYRVAIAAPPKLFLVKRITAVSGVATSGFNDLTTGSKAGDDDNANWPTPLVTYLRGLFNGGSVAPGAEVEYTIYFLNTQNAATNVTICDPVPANMTFVSDGYNSASPRPTESGALPTNTGIALASNATTLPINPTFYLTNANDSDRGRYYPPNDPSTPAACKRVDAAGLVTATGAAANTNGAVVVNVVSGTNQLPPATTSGNPTNSYGYIRFKARVR